MDIAKTSFKLFNVEILITLLSTVGVVIFARYLTPGELGVFFLFQALVSILLDVGNFGLGTAVEKRISEGQRAGEIFATALTIQLAVFAVISLGILFFRGRINAFIGGDFALYLIVTVAAAVLNSLLLAVLRGELRVESTATLPLLNQVVWVGFGAGLLWIGFGVEALVYSFLTGQVIMLLEGIRRVSTSIDYPTRQSARSLLTYAKYTFVGGMSYQAYSWMDVLVIGWLVSQAAVGAYEIAWRVAGIVMMLSSAIAMTILPQVSAWDAEAATDRIEQLFYDSLTPSLLLIIPAIFGIAALSREILGVVFGPEYTVAWIVLIILTTGKIAEGIQKITGGCLHGLNRPDLVAQATVVAGILNIILNIVLVSQFGFVGAAVATVVAYAIGTSMRLNYLSTLIDVRIPYHEIGWCTLSAAAMGFVVFQVQAVLAIDTASGLLIAVLIGVVVYGVLVLVSSRLRYRAIQTARELIG